MTVYIELETSKRNKLTIGTLYRPPKQQAADVAAVYEEIQAMTQNKQSIIRRTLTVLKSIGAL